MSTPSPSSSQQPPPPSSPAPPIAGNKKPQPVPWTHQQTVHLIQTYQAKWIALNRGQLKAGHWEEVAAAVVARCGHNAYHPVKSSTQCRHKMDKLRKRFREEKKRRGASSFGGFACPSSSSSSWPYFGLMESLVRGSPPVSSNGGFGYDQAEEEEEEEEDEEEEEEVEEEESGYRSRSRSINYIIRQPSSSNGYGGSDYSGNLRETTPKKRKRVEENGRGVAAMALAEEIRAFAGKMLGMEKKKMEMVKEMEKMRMEMENKRMLMILDAEKKIIESIEKAFGTQEEK